jgi:anaerobic ribonucleoside-triphosphate reductase activating protein
MLKWKRLKIECQCDRKVEYDFMRYHNITKVDMLNGMGLRVVSWFSHCEHACRFCHNPETWDKNSGIPFDDEAKQEIFDELNKEEIKGLTCSGGDPLSTLNRNEVAQLLKEVKEKFPQKDVWVYTGYYWNEIKDIEALNYIDVLVDGKFEKELSIPSPQWCGSNNQSIINVQESLKQDKIILWQPEN